MMGWTAWWTFLILRAGWLMQPEGRDLLYMASPVCTADLVHIHKYLSPSPTIQPPDSAPSLINTLLPNLQTKFKHDLCTYQPQYRQLHYGYITVVKHGADYMYGCNDIMRLNPLIVYQYYATLLYTGPAVYWYIATYSCYNTYFMTILIHLYNSISLVIYTVSPINAHLLHTSQ